MSTQVASEPLVESLSKEDENKALVRQAVQEFVNEGNTDVAEELWAADYCWHPGDGVSGVMGREDHIRDYREFRTALPDLHLEIDDMLADGDKVVTRFTMTGTHTGPLRKARTDTIIPPTGTKLKWTGMVIHRIENGKIVEGHVQYDYAGIARQIGETL